MSAELQEVKSRFEAVEKTISKQFQETRPICEQALAETIETRAEIREAIQKLRNGIDVLIGDGVELRAEQRTLERRVGKLEPR
jgi:hypothetical protein